MQKKKSLLADRPNVNAETLNSFRIPHSKICENDVNEAYLEYLVALDEKMFQNSEQELEDVLSIEDVKPPLDLLCKKVIFFPKHYFYNGL